jgi:hypothetical protein
MDWAAWVQIPAGVRFFSLAQRPDRLGGGGGKPRLLTNGYQWLFPRG